MMTHANEKLNAPTSHAPLYIPPYFIIFIIDSSASSAISHTPHSANKSIYSRLQLIPCLSRIKHLVQDQVIGVPFNKAFPVKRMSRLLLEDANNQHYTSTPANKSLTCKPNKTDSVLKRMNKLGKKADKFAHGIREHVRLGAKITETLKGKLSLGARILQVGGVKKVFRHLFSVSEGERLLRACQCYLFTTAGPIAGLLFTSTEKIAFCSERSIKLTSPEGKFARVHYKVVIPLRKIQRCNQSENAKKPSEKYIEITTVDDFDFWFMGFLSYHKAFRSLQQAISLAWTSATNQITQA